MKRVGQRCLKFDGKHQPTYPGSSKNLQKSKKTKENSKVHYKKVVETDNQRMLNNYEKYIKYKKQIISPSFS